MLANISLFNSLSPNMQAANDLGNRDFSTFQNPQRARDNVVTAGKKLAQYGDDFGFDVVEPFKDLNFKTYKTKGMLDSVDGAYSRFNEDKPGLNKTITFREGSSNNAVERFNSFFGMSTVDTILHELIHAVSDLNAYMKPYKDSIPNKEKTIKKIISPYSLYQHEQQPDNYAEYSSTMANQPKIFRSFPHKGTSLDHYNNVLKLWRDNAQLTKDEVINRPYSTIQSYLGAEKDMNESTSMELVSKLLDTTCQYASQVSKMANWLVGAITETSEPLKQEEMQQVPFVRDNSSSLYSSISSYYNPNNVQSNTDGLYTSYNGILHTAQTPIDKRKKDGDDSFLRLASYLD